VIPVAAVMVMPRTAEAVVTVEMAAVVEVPMVVTAMRPVLRLRDHVTGRCGRLRLNREWSGLRGVRRRSEAQAGDRDRQCGDLDHGLSCASQHYRWLHFRLRDGFADRGSTRGPVPETTRGHGMIPSAVLSAPLFAL
jgi:hypothetical protein